MSLCCNAPFLFVKFALMSEAIASVLELPKHVSLSPRPTENLIPSAVSVDVNAAVVPHNNLTYFGHLRAVVGSLIDELFPVLGRGICSMYSPRKHTQENNI